MQPECATIDRGDDTAMAGETEAIGPLRRCIVTRAPLEKGAMIRFVLDGEGVVTPDLKGKLPGRGLWVAADRATILEAVKRNAFAKAAKTKAVVPAGLADRVRLLAEREVVELIGLAKRSGNLVAGFEKAQAALRSGKVRLLLEASDGATVGREKLARLAGPGVDIHSPLPSERLAAALGREHAVHVAVMRSGVADRLAAAIRRLERLSAGEDKRIMH